MSTSEPPGTNWSGTYRYRARVCHTPASLDELRRLAATLPRLHAVASRHTFNGVGDSEALVSLDALPGRIELDMTTGLVRVPAATRYGTLAAHLQHHGRGLANLASLPHIAVAGAVATGTHGSGNTNPTLASAVRELTLLTSTGDLITLQAGHPDFAGAVVGLGALGIVTDLVLSTEATYEIAQVVYEGLTWERLLADFDGVLGAGYSVSVLTDFCGPGPYALWVKHRQDGAAGALSGLPAAVAGARPADGPRHPTRGNDPRSCTPQLGSPGPWSDRLAHFRADFTPSTGAEMHSEYFVERASGADAVGALRPLGPRIAPLVLSCEIRTVAADELWLSPAYHRDCAAFHFTWRPEPAAAGPMVDAIESALAPYAPRPHWGKVFHRPARPWPELFAHFDDFWALADRYDARGAFANAYTQSLRSRA